MSPFNAFLFLQGLETLSLRMARHVENAAAVASYLESHELASNVTYPGLATSRYRPLVDKYLPRGAGAVFSFDCRGGRAAGQDFIRGVTLWSHLANVGDSKSLIIHPASTTHRQLDEEELRAAGVGPGTIRLSVGIEAVDDLIWDLEQGFARVGRVGGNRGGVPMTPSFDLSRYQDPLTIQRVIHSAKTIAIVGLSKNQLRASYFVGFYLRRHGYRVIPVNPREPEIFGEKSFNSLADVPVPVDIVNVFRAPEALPGIAKEAVAIGATNLWCQFSVINEEGGRIAEAGGLSVDHGSVHQGRTCPLCGTDALARLQHPAHHVRARRPSVARPQIINHWNRGVSIDPLVAIRYEAGRLAALLLPRSDGGLPGRPLGGRLQQRAQGGQFTERHRRQRRAAARALLVRVMPHLLFDMNVEVREDPPHYLFERDDHLRPGDHQLLKDVHDACRARSHLRVRPLLYVSQLATGTFRHRTLPSRRRDVGQAVS